MKKTVAVIGSRGAIGNAVVDTLLADESVEAVFKFSRAEITAVSYTHLRAHETG